MRNNFRPLIMETASSHSLRKEKIPLIIRNINPLLISLKFGCIVRKSLRTIPCFSNQSVLLFLTKAAQNGPTHGGKPYLRPGFSNTTLPVQKPLNHSPRAVNPEGHKLISEYGDFPLKPQEHNNDKQEFSNFLQKGKTYTDVRRFLSPPRTETQPKLKLDSPKSFKEFSPSGSSSNLYRPFFPSEAAQK